MARHRKFSDITGEISPERRARIDAIKEQARADASNPAERRRPEQSRQRGAATWPRSGLRTAERVGYSRFCEGTRVCPSPIQEQSWTRGPGTGPGPPRVRTVRPPCERNTLSWMPLTTTL